MSLEEEMLREIHEIELELSRVNFELAKYSQKIDELMHAREKLEHDLRILKSHFEPHESRGEVQVSLAKIVR